MSRHIHYLKNPFWTNLSLLDKFGNSLKILPFSAFRIGKYINNGHITLKFTANHGEERKEARIFARDLFRILEYDFHSVHWLKEAQEKKLILRPTKNENYHRFVLMEGSDYVSISLNNTDVHQMKAVIQGIIPFLCGFQYLIPTAEEIPKTVVTHQIKRAQADRFMRVCFYSPHHTDRDFIMKGSYYVTFHESDVRIDVPLRMMDISRICAQDFRHSHHTLDFVNNFSEQNEASMSIVFHKDSYFITATREKTSICFKLRIGEFEHIRLLFKASIPVLSGFEYAFNYS